MSGLEPRGAWTAGSTRTVGPPVLCPPVAGDESGKDAGDGFAAPGLEKEGGAVAAGGEVRPVYRGTGVSAALVIGVMLAILAIIVAVQNTDDVRVDFLAWDADAPLVAVILGAAVAGVLVDETLGFFRRRHRRRHLAERAELRRLRR